ncbi:MAG: Aerobic carbon monoxide dehydrogenase (quinone), medium chain [uncultured Nocardioidaceae bacterium]|uniref:Aerobic carbon monoxide dehydrogenase (Quinone), medium chain n=1 Tax=uncultured Nocardioidaceae bacterium TaxID=253824 RepID=A0A6J4MSC3_9ACTN|nr:MAG: Aerobic carbon monoxide dehydrogenase (quinone), medium chain [uncultured Nocardioidaceae bacterium]
MKPSPFTYHRPHSADEAVELLRAYGDSAKVLAGGQSLVPLMSMRLAAPEHLVDINRVEALQSVEVGEDEVRVGAAVRHSRLERDEEVYGAVPLLRQGLVNVAHPAIRNRGTTVGSLVHADPAAEMAAVLLLLDGVVELRSATDSREVAAADFFLGPMQSATGPGELAVAARFGRPPPGSGSAFVELSRRQGDYAMCGVGALVTTGQESEITSAKVALVGVGDGPALVDVTSAAAGPGGAFREPQLAELLASQIAPESDIHASAEYRRHLALVLTRRALGQAHERAAA